MGSQVDVGVRRFYLRVNYFDLVQIYLQFFRSKHGQCRMNTLPHFCTSNRQFNLVVRCNVNESIERFCPLKTDSAELLFLIIRKSHSAQTQCKTTSDYSSGNNKCPATYFLSSGSFLSHFLDFESAPL